MPPQKPVVPELSLQALPGLPMVAEGDDLVHLISDSLSAAKMTLCDGDIVVIAQKIVSKIEGRMVDLRDVVPSASALALAEECGKDARIVELILSEAVGIVRHKEGVIIARNRQGLVLANAGIDASNVPQQGNSENVLLLPKDPDGSADRIRFGLEAVGAARIAVIITDSLGRAWREGTLGTAIGVSGLSALVDLRGDLDLYGRELKVSQIGLADACAAAAEILMGEGDQAQPVVLLRGVAMPGTGSARDLIRPKELDLFR